MRVAVLTSPLPPVSLGFLLAPLAPTRGVRRAQARDNSASCIRPRACGKGLWSDATCQCDCIPSICRNATGICADAFGQCDAATNPWEDCTLGTDCPWWDNDARRAESCTTRRRVPPGVWDLFASEAECCAAHHPSSTVCGAAPAPPPPRPTTHPTTKASLYEVVPVEFDVSGLPEEVDVEVLADEVEQVLRRALVHNLAERIPGLKVTDVKQRAAAELTAGRAQFHYDVTVLRHPDRGKRFGPLIISELRNAYEDVIEDIEAYTEMAYFGNGVDFVWCADDQCSLKELIAPIWEPIKFSVPQEVNVDMEAFLGQLKVIYEGHLQGIEKLDILDIETRIDERTVWTRDIFLTVHYVGKYQLDDLGPAINRQIKRSESDISVEIEAYLLSQTGADTSWSRNKKGTYTVRIKGKEEVEEEEEEGEEIAEMDKVGNPLWAIIALATVGGLVFLCLLVGLIVHCVKKHSRYKDDWHEASHETRLERDFKERATRSAHLRCDGSRDARPHFLDRRREPRREQQHERPRDDGRGGRRRPRGERNEGHKRRRPRVEPIIENMSLRHRDDTLYLLKNANSFHFDGAMEKNNDRPAAFCNAPAYYEEPRTVRALRPGSSAEFTYEEPRVDMSVRPRPVYEEPPSVATLRPGPFYVKPHTVAVPGLLPVHRKQSFVEEDQSAPRPDPEDDIAHYPARPDSGGRSSVVPEQLPPPLTVAGYTHDTRWQRAKQERGGESALYRQRESEHALYKQ